jgi:ABC-type lipoprotein release transport system permease subunit
VSQRTHEIGVRVALGARTSDVVRLVTWQGSRAIGAGIVLGATIALFASLDRRHVV